MSIEYLIEPDDIRAFYERALPRSAFMRETMTKQRRAWTFIAFSFGLGLSVFASDWRMMAIAVGGALLAWATYPASFEKRVVTAVLRQRELEKAACDGKVHTLSLTDVGLLNTCETCDCTIKWPQVEEVVLDDGRLMVLTKAGTGMVLSRSAIQAGSFDEFYADLLTRVGANARTEVRSV